MAWLRYHDDEVLRFHSEFEILGNQVLSDLSLQNHFEWSHHLRLPGSSGIIPDYVLRSKVNNEWILAFEIKRTLTDVYSSRYQYQAKSYAEDNRLRYRANYPLYFVLSNLEATILFAVRETERPEACRIENGFYISGSFQNTAEHDHKTQFKSDLRIIVENVINTRNPVFENVWPGIVDELSQHSRMLSFDNSIAIDEPNTLNWGLVRAYLNVDSNSYSKTLFFLRCLLAEYLRGRLHFYSHPRNSFIPPIVENSNSVTNSIAALSTIDFQLLFGGTEKHYAQLSSDLSLNLIRYIKKITAPEKDVANLALVRDDAPTFLESFMDLLDPLYLHDGRGKIPTDPELASILSCLSICDPNSIIIDPCCGDGSLMLGGYERLKMIDSSNINAINQIYGIEADPLLIRLACIRLAMTSPSNIDTSNADKLIFGDLFSNSELISSANVILLNPPFRRYEEQELAPFPVELRNHYKDAIRNLKGSSPVTISGQPNLFNYFIEFVGESMTEDSILAVILDNKWYHNKYGIPLKTYLLDNFHIQAVVEYPHTSFFRDHDIATSILIVRKRINPVVNENVKFIRSTYDPRNVDLMNLSNAMHRSGAWPIGWTCISKAQAELEAKVGWKSFFVNKLRNDYRFEDWPNLKDLFSNVRRGSLQKEEGGLKVFAFPFTINDFGPKRSVKLNGRPYETRKGAELTTIENERLANLASIIPEEFRGYALQNSDDINNYILEIADVSNKQCFEPPALRHPSLKRSFISERRSAWTTYHDLAIDEMNAKQEVRDYLQGISDIVGLNESVLRRERLWVDLKEPYAGELIIPRKTRSGHKVHINKFAILNMERQVRLSSNFLSFSSCNAASAADGLDLNTAVCIIAAFLLSSFGQLQFEMLGNNREGLLSIEENNFEQMKVFDPRWVRIEKRREILEALDNLHFPINNNVLSNSQAERNRLDSLFADEIIHWQEVNHQDQLIFEKELLLREVHDSLDGWLIARQP